MPVADVRGPSRPVSAKRAPTAAEGLGACRGDRTAGCGVRRAPAPGPGEEQRDPAPRPGCPRGAQAAEPERRRIDVQSGRRFERADETGGEHSGRDGREPTPTATADRRRERGPGDALGDQSAAREADGAQGYRRSASVSRRVPGQELTEGHERGDPEDDRHQRGPDGLRVHRVAEISSPTTWPDCRSRARPPGRVSSAWRSCRLADAGTGMHGDDRRDEPDVALQQRGRKIIDV